MPQSDTQKSQNSKGTKAQTSPTFQQLLQGDSFSSSSSNKQKQDDDGNHHNKKSVLAKVKEKAKKLRFSFSVKKRREENDLRGHSAPPPVAVSHEDKAEHAEYHDAQTSESAHAPDTNKPSTQHLDQEPPISTSHTEPTKPEPTSPGHTTPNPQHKNHPPLPDPPVSTIPTTEPKTHESPNDDLPESTNGSRFLGLTILTHGNDPNKTNEPVEGSENKKGESQTWDKGVSVKEYLMHKFEPGEDERALSQVITQTISPRRDKMRDAMNSFLKSDEPTEPAGANSSFPPTNLNLDLKSKSVPASVSLNTDNESKIALLNPSHSFGSSGVDASSSLNETYKLSVASYQSHSLGSGLNPDPGSNPSASSSSPNANPGSNQPLVQAHVSSPNQTQVPSHIESNVTASPGSTAIQSQAPSHVEANAAPSPGSAANQAPSPGHTEANAARSPGSTANQTRSPVHIDASAARSPGSTAELTQAPVYTSVNPTNGREVVEVEKLQKDSSS